MTPETPPAAAKAPAEVEPKAETKSEGAPPLETPEQPSAPPKETTRDEESPLQTPEAPAIDLQFDQEAVAKLRASQISPSDAETAELLLHVSQSPINSHAPDWLPREPNTKGGYS